MMEPWKIKSDDTRSSNSLPTFIVFCEDGEIEPEYFLSFSSNNIKVSPIRNCGKQHAQVDYATEYCRDNDLLEEVNGIERLKLDDGAQVWCVFDRDKEENDRRDTSFTDSINTAEAKGIKTAWSNDDFELWILLHFEEVNPADETYQSRNKYYERLTEIFKSIQVSTQEENKILKNSNFNYYGFMKKKKRFLSITFQHMKGKTQIAIDRAKILATYHANPPKPHHQKSPCTMVHHLVEELIRLGGKVI